MTNEFVRDRPEPWEDGWSRVPHGLWTLDLPAGAKILLAWLHSHSPTFLPKVTMNHARKAVGSSSIKAWFAALETAGFISTVTRPGARAQITLLSDPWAALLGRPTAPKSDRDRAEIGSVTAPKSDHIEEHEVDHLEDHEPRAPESVSIEQPNDGDGLPPAADPPSGLTVNQQAKRICDGYWQWYRDRHSGKDPVLGFMAFRGVVKKALQAGHEPRPIKDALKVMHDRGIPISYQSIDRQLTRPDVRRNGQPGVFEQMQQVSFDDAGNVV